MVFCLVAVPVGAFRRPTRTSIFSFLTLTPFLLCPLVLILISGVAKCDPQSIWNPRKKLLIFRRRYIVGTLTNKTNISILVLLKSLIAFPLTPKHVSQNGHFALNSVLRRYFWSSRFWQYKVYADIRCGSQHLCKFSLDFMPARLRPDIIQITQGVPKSDTLVNYVNIMSYKLKTPDIYTVWIISTFTTTDS